MRHFYTDEINTLVLISLLKQHGIRKVIASPGATNVTFVGSIQSDDFFEIYSAVDERAAAFMACGLAEESGEVVVLSCTGATASRNYIPGLTEAYYRKLPVLAVTSTQHTGRIGNYVAQVVDRSIQFTDMVKKSYQLPTVLSEEDKQSAINIVNEAILELRHHVSGPVHINLATTYSNNFVIEELPQYRKIQRVIDRDYPNLPNGNIGIFVGAHGRFSEEETSAIDEFCRTNNAVVICDHISNYRGKYRFLASLANSQPNNLETKKFDLIIYIGSVHGAYINYVGKELWRVNEDGAIRDPHHNLTYVFEMSELDFFKHYKGSRENNTILAKCNEVTQKTLANMPELPFSNLWIAKKTAPKIPNGSVLHFSILNTLRTWNYFETQDNVECYSTTGGFGIDGCLSAFLGSAYANLEIEHFLIIGDLSFFYDLSSFFTEIPSNAHIMIVNNGVGTEFKNYNHRAAYFGEDADNYIAAKGHNGFKSEAVVKNICANNKIDYYSADNKKKYLDVMPNWLLPKDRPSVMEVFTNDYDESNALRIINSILVDNSIKSKISRKIKKARNVVKRVRTKIKK